MNDDDAPRMMNDDDAVHMKIKEVSFVIVVLMYRYNKTRRKEFLMKISTIENILNSMLETLAEFKSEDTKLYEEQVSEVIAHLKKELGGR